MYVHLFLTILSIIITTTSLVYGQRYLADTYQFQQPSQNGIGHSINNGDLINSNSVNPDSTPGNMQSSLNLPASATEFGVNHSNDLIDYTDNDDGMYNS